MITPSDLTNSGRRHGSWIKQALAASSNDPTLSLEQILEWFAPPAAVSLRAPEELDFFINLTPETESDVDNLQNVEAHMTEIMRLPTVCAGALMPDACPSDGRLGYIPVGGVVATENAIHPGMHSADVCCSMAATFFDEGDATALLDAGMKISHFGGGGRQRGQQWPPPSGILSCFENNYFLKPFLSQAIEHFGTQGDGNHFFYVGRRASDGALALVTHHGSRGPGAALYKSGLAAAEKSRQYVCPDAAPFNAWLVADSEEGQEYWAALQIIREWTKSSHFAIHDRVAEYLGLRRIDRFWNEHNFVFQKSDGLFYHAKGATPAFKGFSADDDGRTLIPLNMSEPILIASGRDAPRGLGFAPHGAGRNLSRTAHVRMQVGRPIENIVAEETVGIDARFYCGNPDISELPSAYKNAAHIRRQIARFGLADVVDTIDPLGCIMAGDWQKDAPWRKKRTLNPSPNMVPS